MRKKSLERSYKQRRERNIEDLSSISTQKKIKQHRPKKKKKKKEIPTRKKTHISITRFG